MGKNITLDKLKTLLEPILHIISKKAEKPNWNENDPNSASYIAGRTHYTEEKFKELANLSENFENLVQWDQPLEGYIVEPIGNFMLVEGSVYTVVYDGEEYELGAYVEAQYGNVIIGNGALVGDGNGDNGLPFAIGVYDESSTQPYAIASTSGMHTFSISGTETVVHQIPSKYLPSMSYVSYENEQDLTEDQKALARLNIGAGTNDYNDLDNKPDIVNDAVRYNVFLNLSKTQKERARNNIAAVGLEELACYEISKKSSMHTTQATSETKVSASGKSFTKYKNGSSGFGEWIGNRAQFKAASSGAPNATIYVSETGYVEPRISYELKSCWGNASYYSDDYENTGENWCAYIQSDDVNNYLFFYCQESSRPHVESGYETVEIKQLDEKFIPATIQRKDPDIEQIETLTLTESAAIERSAEPGGTAYAFKRLVLMFETPADAVVTAGNIYFYSGDAGVGLGYLAKKDASSSVSYLMNDCGPDSGRWLAKYMGGWTGNGNGVYTNNENRRRWLQYAVADYPTLTKVTIPTLPAGTTVQIWGVRANA